MPDHADRDLDLAIDRYLDELLLSGPAGADGAAPDPGLAATVRRVQALNRVPTADALFADRLWNELMDLQSNAGDSQRAVHPAPLASGLSAAPLPHPAAKRWPRAWDRSGWVLAHLATAALLLLTLIGSFFAFGPGRHKRQDDIPVFLPAFSGTTTPRAASEGPIAEFVWQSHGGPDLPLLEPGQPAVDPRGNLWVPDGGYDQFLIFAPDGTFLEAWGTPGSGEGQFRFEDPRAAGSHMEGAVAFDAAGNMYVADTGNHRIQKFGPDRSFITSWGSEGSGNGQFRRPIAVVVDEGGRVYVSDEGWGKIEAFGPNGAWLATWPGLGSPVGLAIAEPRGDVFDTNGAIALWVAEATSVVKFSADGEPLATWNAYGAGDGQFLNPIGVAVDGEGRVYVSDYDADRIQVFAPDGTLLGAWGGSGEAAGRFEQPRGIALDGSGNAYVVEAGGKRVQKFRLLPPLVPMETVP